MEHLTKPDQYARVYNRGSSWHSDLVVMRAMPNGLSLTRCGFSVGKKVGGAVVRNRVKRLLREITRLTPIEPGWDIVFIARSGKFPAKHADLKKAVTELLTRARILANPTPVP